MAVPASNISLQAVRGDLDLSTAGSMTERKVRERVAKYSGDVRLSDFANSVVGQPHTPTGVLGDPPKNRHTFTWARSGSTNDNFYSFPGDDWLRLEARNHFTGQVLDAWTEARFAGQISASGNYALEGRLRTYIAFCPSQVAVVSGSSGYMAGTTNLDFYKFYNKTTTGSYTEHTVSEVISLSSWRPYITIIVYSMNLEQAYIGNAPNEFKGIRLRKS